MPKTRRFWQREQEHDESHETRSCRWCGGLLRDDGFCLDWGGYPYGMECPFSCPLCHGPLDWSGACYRCRGSKTPYQRDTWVMTGDRYECHQMHWRLEEKGPQRCLTTEEVKDLVNVIKAIADRLMRPEDAQGPGYSPPRDFKAAAAGEDESRVAF